MNKPPRFQPGKPSHLSRQNQSHSAIQPKVVTFPQKAKQLSAPPVYRPQPPPQVLQRKAAVNQPRPTGQAKSSPAAPPAYRPQPVPQVLQRKTDTSQKSQGTQLERQPVAPPVYRPQSIPKVLQPKTTA